MHTDLKSQTGDFRPESVPAFKRTALEISTWPNRRFGLVGLIVSLIVFVALSAIFLKSRLFVAGLMLNDTLLFTESGYRVAHGQLPGIDFTSAHGVLWYVPHAIAFSLTGDLVQSVPIAFCIFAVVVFIFAAYIAWTRLPSIIGIFTTLSSSIFVMAPWAVGFKISAHRSIQTTAAEGYNRLGFTVLLLASLLALTPRTRRTRSAAHFDLVFAVASFGVAFYTKMPFGLGVAGMVSLWTLLIARDGWQFIKFAAGAATLIGVVGLLVPGLNSGYLDEMLLHAQINSVVSGRAVARAAFETGPEILVTAVLPILALASERKCNWRMAVYCVSLVAGSIIILTQSYQGPYLIAPGAIAIIALAELTNQRTEPRERTTLFAPGIAFAFGLLMYFAPAFNAIVRHASYASHIAPIDAMPRSYAALRVPTDIDLKPMDAAFKGSLDGEQAYAAARATEPQNTVNALFENEYVYTLTDLPNARLLCGRARNQTAILDFANVSSSLFGHRPVGGYTYAHFGRGFSKDVHWPAERMFFGVDCLFDPKLPDVPSSRTGLWLVYGATISRSFTLAGETAFWRVFVRNGTL